jgi:hypothetical protein
MRALAIITAGFALLASRELPAQHASDVGQRHLLSLFVGAAASSGRHETAVTVGPTYRFLLTSRVAVGPILEMTCYRSETSTLAFGGLFLTPYRGIELTLAPGIEWITATADASDSVVERGEPAFRLGLGLKLPMPRGYSVSPTAAANVGSGAATGMYGFTFGMRF